MSLRQFSGVALASSVFLLPISPVFAQVLPPVDIGDVTVTPEGIITPADAVSLDVRLVSGPCCIEIFQPTQVQVIGSEIFVDIFADLDLIVLPITDERLETVPLGTFGPGTYFYEVTQNAPGILQPQVSGSFQVVPEPSTVAVVTVAVPLLLLALSLRNGRRREARNRCQCGG